MKKEQGITKEEQDLLDKVRDNKKRELDCQKEIVEVLEKYGCNLSVDPNSPISKPLIMIVLGR